MARRILLLAAIVILVPGVAVASQGRTNWFPGATVPLGLTVADENGDGARDVVSGNIRYSASVLLGSGDGRLQRGTAYRAHGEHEAMDAGDLDHNGVTDLVLFDRSSAVTILLADSHGGFRAPVDYAAGRKPWTGTLADVNGDSAADIVALDWGVDEITSADDRLVVLLNNGEGTFGAPKFEPAPPTVLPWALRAADLNGDARVDVVETTDENFVNVLLSRGDGSFVLRTVATDSPSTGLLVTDLNRNGTPDLAVAGELNGGIEIFLGAGDGSFGPPKFARVDLFASNMVVAGDFNHDGDRDLAAALSGEKVNGVVAVLLGRGDGTFLPAAIYGFGGRQRQRPLPPLAAGDLNGDGLTDLISQVGSSVAVLTARPDGTFSDPGQYPAGPPYCTVAWVINVPLPRAEGKILDGGCRVGRIRWAYSRNHMRGRVIAQRPRGYATPEPPKGTRVSLWVSRGRRR